MLNLRFPSNLGNGIENKLGCNKDDNSNTTKDGDREGEKDLTFRLEFELNMDNCNENIKKCVQKGLNICSRVIGRKKVSAII